MVEDVRIDDYLQRRGLLNSLFTAQFPGLNEICGLLTLPSGWVETRYWLPITDDRYAFLDFSRTFASWKYKPYFEPAFDERLSADPAGSLKNVFLLGTDNNYFHLLMDFIPRLVFFRFRPEIRDAAIVVAQDLPESFSQILSLAMSGIGLETTHRLLPVPRDEVFRLTNAFIPSSIGRRSAVKVWEQFLTPSVTGQGPERIFVMRKDVRHRTLLNQDEVADRLRGLDFVPVEPGRLPFLEQVRMFSNARIVVGVHGAGLTNILFSPPGGHLIDLQVPPRRPFFRDLAAAKRFDYTLVTGTSDAADPTHHKDFVVDVDRLLDALQPVLRRALTGRLRSALASG